MFRPPSVEMAEDQLNLLQGLRLMRKGAARHVLKAGGALERIAAFHRVNIHLLDRGAVDVRMSTEPHAGGLLSSQR